MLRLAAAIVVLLVVACTGDAAETGTASTQPVLVGTVIHVFDGDTIKVKLDSGAVVVRLHSIDTPEHDQPWGPEATAALVSRVQGRQVSLEVVTQDSYDRLVADVFLSGENINAWMVQQGDAWAYRHYLEDRSYCSLEADARASRRGLWSQPPDSWRAPWQWRAVGRGEAVAYSSFRDETVAHCIAAMPGLPPPAKPDAPASNAGTSSASVPAPAGTPAGKCLIKGNISKSGRIYHVPGSAGYDKTRIDVSQGERWFCSEAEARAAGWRPPAGQ
jgi:endonuclease YncB( thermonuclease family)